MINRKEFEICKRRGHKIDFSVLTGWSQCPACAAWVREVTTTEEREDSPPENEISSGFKHGIHFGHEKLRRNEEPIDKEELAICKQRGHVLTYDVLRKGWEQCSACKIWVRENRKIEEREDEPGTATLEAGDQ